MNTITYKGKSFSSGNKVYLRGKPVGTIFGIEDNRNDTEEINLWITNRTNKMLLLTLYRNKVFINQSYRGKLDYLIGDEAEMITGIRR